MATDSSSTKRNIAISERNYERLRSFGKTAESFDETMGSVLTIAERCLKSHKQT
jgi:hypothetical protein